MLYKTIEYQDTCYILISTVSNRLMLSNIDECTDGELVFTSTSFKYLQNVQSSPEIHTRNHSISVETFALLTSRPASVDALNHTICHREGFKSSQSELFATQQSANQQIFLTFLK